MGLTNVLYNTIIPSDPLCTIFLLINPTTLLAALLALLQLQEGLNLSEKKTPKSFSSLAFGFANPINLYSMFTFFLPTCITLHLLTLKGISFINDQSPKLSKSRCSLPLSSAVSTLPHNLVSSANFNKLLLTVVSKSFIYTVNSIGPKMDPCGTPRDL